MISAEKMCNLVFLYKERNSCKFIIIKNNKLKKCFYFIFCVPLTTECSVSAHAEETECSVRAHGCIRRIQFFY